MTRRIGVETESEAAEGKEGNGGKTRLYTRRQTPPQRVVLLLLSAALEQKEEEGAL